MKTLVVGAGKSGVASANFLAARGESVKAYVSLKPGSEVTEQELVDFAKQQMAAYKYPRSIEFIDELPKTTTGKILRRELRGDPA